MIAIYAIYLICVIIIEVIVYLIVCLITSKKKTQPKIQIRIAEKALETLEFTSEAGDVISTLDIKNGLDLEKITTATGHINLLSKQGLSMKIKIDKTGLKKKAILVEITEQGIDNLQKSKKE